MNTEIMTISSQRYLNDEIVEKKLAEGDFVVFVSPVFACDDKSLRVVMDGHHSFAAARMAGVEPTYVEHDASDNCAIAVLQRGDIADFLEMCDYGDEYYDINTGRDVW